jgi:outer membrane immunogenic protein
MMSAASAAAYAADMPLKAPRAAPVYTYNWSGFYGGLNAGGVWDRGDLAITPGGGFSLPPFAVLDPGGLVFAGAGGVPIFVPGTIPLPGTFATSGRSGSFIGGGQVGYNWQSGQTVYGVEAELQGLKTSQGFTLIGPSTVFAGSGTSIVSAINGNGSIERNIEGSLRGRVGYTWDRMLAYATGGLAVTQLKTHAAYTYMLTLPPGITPVPGLTNPATTTTVTDSSMTVAGFTLGGGAEYGVSDNVSVAAEYRHTFYGRRGVNLGATPTVASLAGNGVPAVITAGTPVTGSYGLDTNEVLVRLNWHFSR